MNNNNIEEYSGSNSSIDQEQKIENLKNDFELQNQKKNQQLEELFEEIDEENKELKKEIIQTKFGLEEEKEKNQNLKNTFYNINHINYNNNSNRNTTDIKNSDTYGSEYNYILLNNNIKSIKENNEKKLSEIKKNYLENQYERELRFQRLLLKCKNNVEKEVLINEVKVDDIFVVKPGMSIPVDGVVINGFSSIDESMLTGESMPINKEAGSLVKSATINQDGVLTCKAVRVGSDTTLSQIIQMVEKAANSKAKISQIADKISAIFVPIVIGIAIVVFTFWMIFGQNFIDAHPDIHSTLLSYSINRGISILVISCPCALGLATPVAIMVGSGKGAKNGFLYKNAVALEEVGKTDFVILDKTGTITKGEPTVTDVINYINKEKLLEIAYALENGSSHPLAKAINKYAEDIGVKLIQCDDFINHSGKGVEGRINNIVYYAGNYKFLNDFETDVLHLLFFHGNYYICYKSYSFSYRLLNIIYNQKNNFFYSPKHFH